MEIRLASPEELPQVFTLVKRVFMRFEAPDYSQQGIQTFFDYLADPEKTAALLVYGAFQDGVPVGMLAMRGTSHISLFFVEEQMQGKGIGRALFHAARADCTADLITVNSSPFAVTIYQRLGFQAMSDEQLTDGIRFTPMKYFIRKENVLE